MKPISKILLATLWPFSAIYGCILSIRNRFYDKGILKSTHFQKPYTIVVGNLSVGGTGKTPHTEWLILQLQEQFEVCTLSRGYKRHTTGFVLADENANAQTIGDEPMQYYHKFPDIKVGVAEKRVLGITEIKKQLPKTEVVILDDAFQHRALKADTYILITDYRLPYYQDSVLPMGRLRENISGAHRADYIIVSKCPKDLTKAEQQTILQRIQPKAHQQVYFTTIAYLPVYDYYKPNSKIALKGLDILLVTGIAKPEYLIQELTPQVQTIDSICYPDHHYFTTQDLERICKQVQQLPEQSRAILTTEKDLMRLLLHQETIRSWKVPLLVLGIQVQFLGTDEHSFSEEIIENINLQQKIN